MLAPEIGVLSPIEKHLIKKFRSARKVAELGNGTSLWKNVFFLLDLITTGDFYGTLQLKVLGCTLRNMTMVERTFRVDEMYRDLDGPTEVPREDTSSTG